MCGADTSCYNAAEVDLGSSPRVRSRLPFIEIYPLASGIISACAEQTRSGRVQFHSNWDHLRVCGADMGVRTLSPLRTGSSPRVRSRLYGRPLACGVGGIISACAEQTTSVSALRTSRRDHLRVCGADRTCRLVLRQVLGSSPRVRSRRPLHPQHHAEHGIISACAEQTPTSRRVSGSTWDHLRVCGADSPTLAHAFGNLGSSPRVRSRRHVDYQRRDGHGIISACAEQTSPDSSAPCRPGDHLRVCGADTPKQQLRPLTEGSSPRVRSRLWPERGRGEDIGIISACAEQTGRTSSP